MRIAGCILAGGKSRRMGVNKIEVMLGQKSLLQHTIDRLSPQVMVMAINTNSAIAAQDYPVITDERPDFAGPLAGVLSGLSWAKTISPNIDSLITVPIDVPFFPKNLIKILHTTDSNHIKTIRYNSQLHPIFATWPLSIEPVLRHWLADTQNRSVKQFLYSVPHEIIDIHANDDFDPFFNINTPDDLIRAKMQL